jgi:hypothetical protein
MGTGRRFLILVIALATLAVVMLASPAGAGPSPRTDHVVDVVAQEDHVLVVLARKALCDPAGGDVSKPKDPHFVCRYAIRGTYADEAEESYLGSGAITGRFLIDTRSSDGTVPGYGCFRLTGGVVKLAPTTGGRIRFKLSRFAGRVCQDFDGMDVNGPDRTISWLLKVTPGACAPPYCGTKGKLSWSSTATFDSEAPPGVVEYADTASFDGTVTSP